MKGTEKFGLLAAKLMEQIEQEELPDGLSNPTVGAVALVVEINADEAGNDHGAVRIVYRCTDTRQWVQAGLLLAASDAARDWGVAVDRDEP